MGEAEPARGDLTQSRAERQAGSIRAALLGRGIDESTSELVSRALKLSMKTRISSLSDDHHPAYLHPGRAVLILLHDVDDLPASALPIAALHESMDTDLRPTSAEVSQLLDDEIGETVRSLPVPGAGDLEERLVLLPRDGALAVLAERLDHLRHLHMRPDTTGRWSGIHAEVERAWLPFAQRTDPRLAQRFAHWTRTFRKRLP